MRVIRGVWRNLALTALDVEFPLPTVRSEQPAERDPPPVHEGPVRGALPHCPRQVEVRTVHVQCTCSTTYSTRAVRVQYTCNTRAVHVQAMRPARMVRGVFFPRASAPSFRALLVE